MFHSEPHILITASEDRTFRVNNIPEVEFCLQTYSDLGLGHVGAFSSISVVGPGCRGDFVNRLESEQRKPVCRIL